MRQKATLSEICVAGNGKQNVQSLILELSKFVGPLSNGKSFVSRGLEDSRLEGTV